MNQHYWPASDTRAPVESRTHPEAAASGPPARPSRTRAGAWWPGMVLAAVLLVALTAFIVQNGNAVEIYFLVWVVTLPAGLALLAAATAGILMVAIPRSSRMVQLRRSAHRHPCGATPPKRKAV